MAVGSVKGAGVKFGSQGMVSPGSAHSVKIQANDDARTAQGITTKLYNPLGITDSVFHWARVPQGTTRTLMRARVPIATTAVATGPTVAIIGLLDNGDHASPLDAAGAGIVDGTIEPLRLDAATHAAAGQLLAFQASPTTSNQANDGVWFYSDIVSLTAVDMQGCKWVGAVVTVLGACTASAAMPVDFIFEN